MWETITFETFEDMNSWLNNHGRDYQVQQIFIDNGYGLEIRKLKIINV